MRLRISLFLACLAGLTLACGDSTQRFNVIIIGLDTLRPDHLGCYGYTRRTSPHIDAIAAQGVLFRNVVSKAPWTHPSFATVFTSLYPTQHGATTVKTRMRTDFPTLASTLAARGYLTAAIVNAPTFSPEFGLNRGFDHYDFISPWEERRADTITGSALEWIDTHADESFFIFVHYFDPHLPYDPPPPYDRMFDPAYEGPLGRSFNIDRLSPWGPRKLKQLEALSYADSNHIAALYDGEIVFADSAIGELLTGLERLRLRDKSLLVFLSDHGEEFFDHGGLDHGHSLYNELIRVPLVLSLPGVLPEGTQVTRHARLLDVMPTVLDILNLEPRDRMEGTSLLPLASDFDPNPRAAEALLPCGICYSEALRHRITTKSLTIYPWKLIYDTRSKEKMLFNLHDDPGEITNLATTEPTSLGPVEKTLLRTMLDISDTWYIEMAAGPRPRVFSLDITSKVGRLPAHIEAHNLIDGFGNIMDLAQIDNTITTPSRLSVDALEVTGRMTVAFKLDMAGAPIRLDLSIDGREASKHTFIGRNLIRPVTMPFTEEASENNREPKGEPDRRPEPPYFVIWHQRSLYQGDTSMELDPETTKQLRALGYVQ
jgi:arylsulfatase A-like enzyme